MGVLDFVWGACVRIRIRLLIHQTGTVTGGGGSGGYAISNHRAQQYQIMFLSYSAQ